MEAIDTYRVGHTAKSAFLATLCAFGAVAALGNGDHVVEEIIVYGRAEHHIGTATTASEGVVGYADFHLPPMLRIGELVEAMPGMVATQHSGTGKANQYFLRGFNLDHGTDFSVHLDGVPINMRSHGHGQGYLDLNFIIPELVETAVFRKGVYHAAKGDFSSAGSMDFAYYEHLSETILQATLGEHGYRRGLVAGSTELAGGAFTAAVDANYYTGPWQLDEDLAQHRVYLSQAFALGGASARIALHGYDGQWNATDQIPRRAVQAGLIDSTGFIDPDLGGSTRRWGLTAQLEWRRWRMGAYQIDYDFALFSNFTYLLDDPVLGDEFEQRDRRTVRGLWVQGETVSLVASLPVWYRWGGDLRFDDVDEVGLYATSARVRIATKRRNALEERSLSAYGEMEILLSERLRAVLGLRADAFGWDVAATGADGTGDDSLLSPKTTLAYRLHENVEAYASWGRGFHSNDVRVDGDPTSAAAGSSGNAVDVLATSQGAEVGVRFEPGHEFNATLVGFWLEVDSELVYVGDAGVTEPGDASVRTGLELAAFWHPRPWLAVNASYTASDARFKVFRGGDDRIPGAVENTFSAGVNVLWENGFHMSLSTRYLGPAPLIEDGTMWSGASWLVHAGMTYHVGRTELGIDVFNLLDSDDNDIAYYYESRLANEPPGGLLDTHFHPLEPRSLRAKIVLHL